MDTGIINPREKAIFDVQKAIKIVRKNSLFSMFAITQKKKRELAFFNVQRALTQKYVKGNSFFNVQKGQHSKVCIEKYIWLFSLFKKP